MAPTEKTPVPPGQAEQKLLKQGEQYFNQGKLKPALQQAQEALKLNPDNVEAMYSIATCYLALGESNNSLEFTRRASSYKSHYLPGIYLLMGRTYESLDDPWNALRTYRFAAGAYPDDPGIQYHLGSIYADLNKLELAAESFKTAIRLDPSNAASHFQLGGLYYNNHYPTPALLSLSMALLLEPNNDPAMLIRNNINKLLSREAVTVNKIDEGDFHSVDLALADQRTSQLRKAKSDTEFERTKAQYHTFFMALDKAAFKGQKKTFALEYYVPFYNKVLQQGLDEAFVYYIFQGEKNNTINNWLENNSEKVGQLEKLIK